MEERLDEFYRNTWVEVQLDAIYENVASIIQRLPSSTDMMAVVKANGYGHGAYEIAETSLKAGAKLLGVALLDEAIFLRKKGITAPILVLGYCSPEYAHIALQNEISLTAFQEDWLLQVEALLRTRQTDSSKKLKVHLKVDTGMGRIGIRQEDEIQAVLKAIENARHIELEGIFTHFAKADTTLEPSYYYEQLERFLTFLDIVKDKPKWIHASNSAAALLYPDGLFNLVRSGITIYGLSPSQEIKEELPISLKEAFSLHTTLIHAKKVKKGSAIGYGCTYTAEEDEWIGTISIGYADGWLRALQGQSVLIDGKRAPIVGRICMDQCMIKLPKRYPVGTKVTLIGNQLGASISVDEIAEKLHTINYEVVCMIAPRVPRVYKMEERVIKVVNPMLFS